MEIGMLNFWLELLVTAQTKENYFSRELGKALERLGLYYLLLGLRAQIV